MKNRKERVKITKEFLIEEYINKYKTITQIAKENSKSRKTIKKLLINFNVPIKNISDITKERFKDPKNHPCWKGGKIKVFCSYCNKELLIRKYELKSLNHHFCNRKCFSEWLKISVKGENNPSYKYGKPKCLICRKEIGYYNKYCFKCRNIILSKIRFGSNNPAWIDGRSYVDYPKEFSKSLRNKIKINDNFQCQNCNMIEEEYLNKYGRRLEVHHIDYNRKNCNLNNLITLCKQCNLKANYNREYWEEYYKNKKEVRI